MRAVQKWRGFAERWLLNTGMGPVAPAYAPHRPGKMAHQLMAFSKVAPQVGSYRVKYYFGVRQALTPEQRKKTYKDLLQELSD